MEKLGATLKREREARRISLREVSSATKIKMRYLEALEQDRFDQLPGGVFNKGFIRAYAAHVGMDPDAMVALYAAEAARRRADADAGEVTAAGGPNSQRETGSAPAVCAAHLDLPALDPAAFPSRRGDKRGRRMGALSWGIVIVGAGGLIYLGLDLSERLKGSPDLTIATGEIQPTPPPTAGETRSQTDPSPAGVPPPAPEAAPEGGSTSVETPGVAQPDSGAAPGSLQIAAAGGKKGPAVGREPVRAPPNRTAPPLQSRPVVTEPIAPRGGSGEESAADGAPPPGPMALEVRTLRSSWIWVACDSRVEIDRRLAPGEVVRLDCLRSIRVSAHDAAAVRLRVNGAACLPLGEEGSRVYGYTIRSDDFHLICRPSRGGEGRLP